MADQYGVSKAGWMEGELIQVRKLTVGIENDVS